jgi:hypothetical protein
MEFGSEIIKKLLQIDGWNCRAQLSNASLELDEHVIRRRLFAPYDRIAIVYI